ncbi:MAG: 16S ribosomal RNA methyltransferase KsgA/Dim1 family protein [candidate division BRC1 bacterium ADurb.BinA364]|nr:MAG: 16S ribosomal RNA methyltransferase KsgA/Dim1 family protein [candidate division BRC1 bacterium ADurb.BinA364]
MSAAFFHAAIRIATMISQFGLFLKQTIRAFHTTGAVAPSSRYLAQAMCRPLERLERQGALRVLEVGPGAGAFSRHIAQRLRPGDRLDLVELNPEFACSLRRWARERPAGGPIIRVVQSDILAFRASKPYDLLITGLPLNNFSASLAESLLRHFVELAREGAPIAFFEYQGIRRVKRALLGRREQFDCGGAVIDDWIRRFGVKRERVWRNVPPAWACHFRAPSLAELGQAPTPHHSPAASLGGVGVYSRTRSGIFSVSSANVRHASTSTDGAATIVK